MAEGVFPPENQGTKLIADSDILLDCPCQPCQIEGSLREGLWYCADCDENLCDECRRYHRKYAPSRNHVVVNTVENSPAKEPANMSTKTCTFHVEKQLEYYCRSHGTLACAHCVAVEHTSCVDAVLITDSMQEETLKEEIRELCDILQKVSFTSDGVIESSIQNIEHSKNYCQKAIEFVHEIRKKVEEAFDNLEAKVKSECDRIRNEDSSRMSATISVCKEIKKEADSLHRKFRNLENLKMKNKMFTEVLFKKARIKSLEASLERLQRNNIVHEVKYFAIENTDALVSRIELHGKVARKEQHHFEHLRDIVIKNDDDDLNPCKITGMCMLSGNRLALADNKNQKIKLVDISKDVIVDELVLSSNPWDIETVFDESMAVTLPEESKFLIISTSSTGLRVLRCIRVGGKYLGLACHNKTIVSTVKNNGKVNALDILTINNDEVSTVTSEYVPTKTNELSGYVSLLNSGNEILVSNGGTGDIHIVRRLSRAGKLLATYENEILKGPNYTIMVGDYLYACGWISNNFVQINTDTGVATELLAEKDGLDKPYTFWIDRPGDKLYIGMRDTDKIKVFKCFELFQRDEI